ncbi:hypothetical protein JX265_000925 [Neoarthrinium moseri]|uniref:Uncharacterized protein n=1 Tax=Neoarthrinium moseri TaxID=1658444 RepID=A0A9P9WWU6_9PEZI|nr:hypothetical protein JX265_000925 [Neoarthrinium moseri]
MSHQHTKPTSRPAPTPPAKQRMALGFRSLVDSAKRLVTPLGTPSAGGTPQNERADGGGGTAKLATELFPATDPAVDGDDCTHDCESCHVSYPRGFKTETADVLYGHVKGWSTHVLVATGKTDWVRDVEDEKGSLMQAFGAAAAKPANGRLMLSASNIPLPGRAAPGDYAEPTTVLVLPAFRLVEAVRPPDVPALVRWLGDGPTNTSPLAAAAGAAAPPSPPPLPPTIAPVLPDRAHLLTRPCPHAALVLLCSQKTRDARCGQSAPLLRKELERHLRPLGLFRDLDDERPGGVAVYFISHVGGHKYSANVMVYRRPDAFGVDGVARAALPPGEELRPVRRGEKGEEKDDEGKEEVEEEDVGAAQCIWLARVKPEDCENLVKYTVLQGKVVKPDTQLRGGFDRSKGLMSW